MRTSVNTLRNFCQGGDFSSCAKNALGMLVMSDPAKWAARVKARPEYGIALRYYSYWSTGLQDIEFGKEITEVLRKNYLDLWEAQAVHTGQPRWWKRE